MRISPLRAAILAGWMSLIFTLSAQADSGEQSDFFLRWVLGPLASHLSPEQFDAVHHLLRKAAHFTEYAILALLWVWNLGTAPGRLALAWGLATLYAASDELHQAFVPARGPSGFDVAIDSAGALAAIVMVAIIRFLIHARGHAAGSSLSRPLSGVRAIHASPDMRGVLGGDPAGPDGR